MIRNSVGDNEETVDFDGKHIAKRVRNSMIKKSFKIGKVAITNSDMRKQLEMGSTSSTRNTVSSMMNPKDKQNVALATEFLVTFCSAVQNHELDEISPRVLSMKNELRVMSYIIDGLLSLYSYTTLSIEEQLQKISTASHLLLVYYREFKTSFLPSQLYHDLQSTFKNAYFCAAKFKVYHPNLPLFLMLLGSDLLERIFGNIRLKYGLNALDALELLYSTRSMRMIQVVMERNPDWVKSHGKVMTRLSLDYSKPTNWDVSKLTMEDVDMHKAWEKGRNLAATLAGSVTNFKVENYDFARLAISGVTLIKPFGAKGAKVGLQEAEIDWSLDTLNDIDDATMEPGQESESVEPVNPVNQEHAETDQAVPVPPVNENGSRNTASLIDYIEEPSATKRYDPQIQLEDGKHYFKASIVRQLFNSSQSSRDRLKRVQGMSKYIDSSTDKVNSLEDVCIPGDPVLSVSSNTPKICVIRDIKVGGRKQDFLNGSDLQNPNVSLILREIIVSEDGDKLIWGGACKENDFTIDGKFCMSFQPDVVLINDKYSQVFSKSMMMDMKVQFSNSDNASGPSRSSATSTSSKANHPLVEKYDCFVCKQKVKKEDMRTHVGRHILADVVKCRFPCGWCGRECCPVTLVATGSKKGGKKVMKPGDNCVFKIDFFKRPTLSKRNKCSNYIEECPKCKVPVWTYNFEHHYADLHPDMETVPIKVTEDERKNLMKLNI